MREKYNTGVVEEWWSALVNVAGSFMLHKLLLMDFSKQRDSVISGVKSAEAWRDSPSVWLWQTRRRFLDLCSNNSELPLVEMWVWGRVIITPFLHKDLYSGSGHVTGLGHWVEAAQTKCTCEHMSVCSRRLAAGADWSTGHLNRYQISMTPLRARRRKCCACISGDF